jgi:hypothetical protein
MSPPSKRLAALVYADHLVGQREQGRNAGSFVTKLLGAVGLGPGFPWCAAFVSYCLKYVGLTDGPKRGRAAVRNWVKWAIDNKRLVSVDVVRPGDLFAWLNKDGTGHIGFVRDLYFHGASQKWKIKTIEGNTNDAGVREGDGVYRKVRSVNGLLFIKVGE